MDGTQRMAHWEGPGDDTWHGEMAQRDDTGLAEDVHQKRTAQRIAHWEGTADVSWHVGMAHHLREDVHQQRVRDDVRLQAGAHLPMEGTADKRGRSTATLPVGRFAVQARRARRRRFGRRTMASNTDCVSFASPSCAMAWMSVLYLVRTISKRESQARSACPELSP